MSRLGPAQVKPGTPALRPSRASEWLPDFYLFLLTSLGSHRPPWLPSLGISFANCFCQSNLLGWQQKSIAHESSPAQRFCAGLLLEMQGGEEVTPNGGPGLYLPFEILAKIFIAFRDLVLESSAPSIGALLTFLHVCCRWRDISLYTGALWTQIVLTFHTKRHYARLHILVQQPEIRRRPYPISLTIRSCYPHEHNPVIDFISAHASRIRDLSLQLPAAHYHRFLCMKGRSFPGSRCWKH
ncbi:hypothetical protein C8R47DRAFT_1102290 [Mycena vitilis]|nr:hypothetical protein C8R47DRAFT_1102290 [Mycena vitilis]